MQARDYRLQNEADIASPQLIYYSAIIRENTRKAIDLAGSAGRLWPHIKTHKMAEMIHMQREMGIDRFKCATVAELALAARCGASHALMAYPLVGPNIEKFLGVAAACPATRFYAIVDSPEGFSMLEAACAARGIAVDWLADVDMGMHRTGLPLDEVAAFCRARRGSAWLRFQGLHCYDGHIGQRDLAERRAAAAPAAQAVRGIRAALSADGIEAPIIILGGSPSFPCHAGEEDVYLSPGTVFVWDWGYLNKCPDLPFVPGAAILARVISRPAPDRFTLDLGYKAISADPKGARGLLLDLPEAEPLFQSEEHWVWKMPQGQDAAPPAVGSVLYVIPTHICPTTALYPYVLIAEGGRITGRWVVAARDR